MAVQRPAGTCPPAPPPRPARRSSLLGWRSRLCSRAGHGPCGFPPWLRQTTPKPGGQGPCPSLPGRFGSPPFPPPGGLDGLRPAIEAIPGARPGCCVRRCGGLPPPPVAKLRSCVAALRSLRRRPPPPLLTPRPRLAVPLPAGCGFVGRAGGIARPATCSRECHPWRAGVLPGVPPAPSMAPGQGLRFKRRSHLDSRSGGRVRLRWPAAPTGFVPQPLGLRASTALLAVSQASGLAGGPVTGLAKTPRWRLRPPPGQPQARRPSLPKIPPSWLELRGILPWVVTAEDSILPPCPPAGGDESMTSARLGVLLGARNPFACRGSKI